MPLSLSINPDTLVDQAHDDPILAVSRSMGRESSKYYSVSHGGRYQTQPVPKYSIPDQGMDAETAYQIVADDLQLDGKPGLNLATFVHTWMPEPGRRLITETMNINICDQDEYPATMSVHSRCISILADLWKQPKMDSKDGRSLAAIGTATTGSSEAIMLGLLAAKKRWQARRKAEGKSPHEPGPNLVFGSNVQVAIEKFARYWDVEERPVPIDESTNYCLDPKRALEHVDENTIAVVVILGSTYTGHYEPVAEIAELLDEYQERTGIDIPIHVDGASGAMVAPFATPDLKWSFDIPRVVSINTSGHKFGMVLPGLGWIIFRSADLVPKELVFELHYLGSVEYSFGLNFSRPAAPVLAQMFNFLNLGRDGYTRTMNANLQNARLLSRALEHSGLFTVISDIHRPVKGKEHPKVEDLSEEERAELHDARHYTPGLPVVAFRWTDEFQKKYPHLRQHALQVLLRTKGWIVPNYELSHSLESVQVLRVVVKDTLTENMIDTLVHDIIEITRDLAESNTEIPGTAIGCVSTSSEAAIRHARRLRNDASRGRPMDLGARPGGYNKQC
ncbi:glutamate decarboxylase [Malassezia cuniculi]|uniref:Glutamate decarboxylase n=1 Tax=Malassezia cuniculi TaxID=948313 RepID=A0AAF0J864_9BASI|nr:glutamate decarboxylase [Malassezia cuniculi]